jgi:hypothetical protein
MDFMRAIFPRLAPLLLALAFASSLHAQSLPASPVAIDDASIAALADGDYLWAPGVAPAGQVLVVVSLPEQRAYVYRAGIRIGVSSVSTGTATHPTPTGVFEILQKQVDHRSNLYNDAPMPYMQRLTWDGIALHAGKVTGRPASHGCVRLPHAFAEALFAETEKGGIVVIADDASHTAEVVHPGATAPVDIYTGMPLQGVADRLSPLE